MQLCYRMNGYWVYPIIAKLSVGERVGIYAVWIAAIWGAWCGVEELKSRIHGNLLEGGESKME